MAKRKIEIYIDVYTEKDFDYLLNNYKENIICAQIYCSYFGYCTALDHLFLKIKLDWSDGQAVLLRVAADEIDSLERFRGHSEPVFLFILNRRVLNVFRGVDYVTFGEVAKKEIEYFKQMKEGCHIERPTFAIDEATPNEIEWLNARKTEREEVIATTLALKVSRQEARKKHRAELMVPHLRHLNFVLYWPHTTHAHPELYERWGPHNIIMVGREEIQLTKEMAEDVLYAGDAPVNEASMYELLSAPALAICFRILDTERNFVELVRKILYEEIPPIDESKPISDQPPQKTAFDLYKSYSLTKEEILETRREERDRRKNLKALEEFERSSLDIEVDIVIPEALSDEELEASSEEDDEDEYFPPAGLLIPGFYAPPNEIAKVNGLAVLFPKIVLESVTPQPEFLPPHVLVLLDMTKRYNAVEILSKHTSAVIHIGIFQLTDPPFSNSLHVAYSVKQFESLQLTPNLDNLKLAVMLSVQIDLPLLGLMDLSPCHVSRDAAAGEAECAAIFPVDYGDDYPEFEDFDLP
ncbi:PREDICTED: uncharacterized protein LOC106114527 isoform X3 [Papilio xuthus]|uniref:Uncharacterized protein LOC106114527 isoform X3 n=1 Tax=Papilio xuthus TaxID=66420 RepID=A0AAJ7E5A0_PAPXU|nr:PREDICTED: uncharacterized protein LOC106114527 isoform X3 [Papilio xuthus]